MVLIKLGCAGCGAPLDIKPDVDSLACGYCGTSQHVERSGGAVSLRKVESAIKAVQRGTDRTAAELALPRLKAELNELEQQAAAAVSAAEANFATAKRGRRKLPWIVFAVIFFGGPMVMSGVQNSTAVGILGLLWMVGSVAVPIFVYSKTKLPNDETPGIKAHYSAQIARVRQQLAANRAIVDAPH